jgi:hypothetical protein
VRAAIDAREGGAARVAGLTVVGRQLRLLARAGFAGATLVGMELPPDAPAGFPVTLADEMPAHAERVLDGRELHTADTIARGRPVARVDGDPRAAERELALALRKTVAADGPLAFYVVRPVSRAIALPLARTFVAPNAITLLALGLGITAAAAAARGAGLLAGIALWLGSILDCVDGDLARLKLASSRAGEWLDTLTDDLTTFSLLAAVGWHLGGAWWVIGAAGAGLGMACSAKLYADLARLRLPIDTARYPWFFGEAYAGTLRPGLQPFSVLFRRDVYVTVVSVFLATGLERVACGALAGGAVVLAGMVVGQLVFG